MSKSNLLPVGRIRKAHGIKGEVSVTYYADSPLLLQNGVFLAPASLFADGETPSVSDENAVFYGVTAHRQHHGALLVLLDGVADRNAAEALRGMEMLVPEDTLPAASEGEIYLYQVLGLTVLASNPENPDQAEKALGTISGIAEHAGQELWTIGKEGEADILFPATPEFVLEFDLERGIVRIAPPPGLIELYRP